MAEKKGAKKASTKKPSAKKASAKKTKTAAEPAPASYPPKKLKEFEKMLLERQREILEGIEEQREETEGFKTEREPDDYDDASNNVDMNIQMMLNDTQKRELDQIENALLRIKGGAYGVCEVTGELIAEARLKALPYTTMSVEAAARDERGRVEVRRDTPRSVRVEDDFLMKEDED